MTITLAILTTMILWLSKMFSALYAIRKVFQPVCRLIHRWLSGYISEQTYTVILGGDLAEV